jgi:D-tyrosyl-tRNA(Tyr) deacylase
MNRSLLDVKGELLVVSQFTIMADCRKGRRPSFTDAAPPEPACRLYRFFAERASSLGVTVKKGKFQANMDVSLINQGPVTLMLESPEN